MRPSMDTRATCKKRGNGVVAAVAIVDKASKELPASLNTGERRGVSSVKTNARRFCAGVDVDGGDKAAVTALPESYNQRAIQHDELRSTV